MKSKALVLKVISKLYFSSAHVLSYFVCNCVHVKAMCVQGKTAHTHTCVYMYMSVEARGEHQVLSSGPVYLDF